VKVFRSFEIHFLWRVSGKRVLNNLADKKITLYFIWQNKDNLKKACVQQPRMTEYSLWSHSASRSRYE